MIEQTGNPDRIRKITGWVATNLLAVFFMGIIVFFWCSFYYSHSSVTTSGQFLVVVLFGGGVFITIFQSLFLRLSHIQIPGRAWWWIGSGIISSILSFLMLGVIFFVFAYSASENPQRKSELLLDIILMIWVVGIHKSFLAVVHSILLKKIRCKRVLLWLLINVLGYAFTAFISTMIWNNIHSYETPTVNNGMEAILSIFLIALVFLVETASGWRFFQVLDTGEAWTADPDFQKAIRTGHPIQAGPGDKI